MAWLEGLPEHSAAGIFVLANRTMIEAFTAQRATLGTREPSPLGECASGAGARDVEGHKDGHMRAHAPPEPR